MKLADLLETTSRWIYPGIGCGAKHRVFDTKFLGVFTGQGKNKDEAEQSAIQAAKDAGTNQSKRKYFFSPSGKSTFVVYFDGSWCYDIVGATRDANKNVCVCSGIESFEAACRMAASHAKDYED